MIALIGAGNVATWIASRLQNSKEFPIGQVYSRNMDHARRIADMVGAEPIDDLKQLTPSCEIYLFSLKDDAYHSVLSQLDFELPVAVHTAGTVSQDVFKGFARHYGVLYPLQTFTKEMDMCKMKVPLCVEDGKLQDHAKRVWALASELSDDAVPMTEQQRQKLHLAAVFACNFSNAMYAIADKLLQEGGMSLELLKPLLWQTLEKINTMTPKEAQTGPARRNDRVVMEQQLAALPDEELRAIYKDVSKYIVDKFDR